MSSHYIYLACSYPGCETRESIYTGDVMTDEFPDSGPDSFEGETISTRCNEHVDSVIEEEGTPAPLTDFDTFVETHNIKPEEVGAAFGAWMNGATGWDGDVQKIEGTTPTEGARQ